MDCPEFRGRPSKVKTGESCNLHTSRRSLSEGRKSKSEKREVTQKVAVGVQAREVAFPKRKRADGLEMWRSPVRLTVD